MGMEFKYLAYDLDKAMFCETISEDEVVIFVNHVILVSSIKVKGSV